MLRLVPPLQATLPSEVREDWQRLIVSYGYRHDPFAVEVKDWPGKGQAWLLLDPGMLRVTAMDAGPRPPLLRWVEHGVFEENLTGWEQEQLDAMVTASQTFWELLERYPVSSAQRAGP
jgi:hypothetical protein